MKPLLLFCFLLTTVAASAQKIRFTDTSNRWKIESVIGIVGESCQEIAVMKMGADTLINGLSYKKPEILYYSHRCEAFFNTYDAGGTPSAKIAGYYREDTMLGRVYCRSIWSGDSVEHVIYDAAWRIGDTLAWGTTGQSSGKSVVAGFDSAFINNVWHKVFRMAYLPQGGYPSYDIVEGIGCLYGPAYPVHAIPPFENSDRLRCFSQGGIQPPFVLASGRAIRFNNTTSCAVVRLGVPDGVASAAVQVVPNPGGGGIVLQIPPAVKSGTVRLTDVSGRTVGSFDFHGKDAIPIGQYLFTPGVYYYFVRDAVTGSRYTGRFIFQ